MTPAINGFSSSRFRCMLPRTSRPQRRRSARANLHNTFSRPISLAPNFIGFVLSTPEEWPGLGLYNKSIKKLRWKKICYAALFCRLSRFPRIFHRVVSTFKKSICNCWPVHFPQFFIIGPIQEEHFVVLKTSFGPN